MREVVMIVVSMAEMNRQSHNPVMTTCSLRRLILGTFGAAVVAGPVPVAIRSSWAM
jgi:hypothetical protein